MMFLGISVFGQNDVRKIVIIPNENYTNCDSVVKHYADSMKTIYKAKHNEIEAAKVLARKQVIWGKTSDGLGYNDPLLYLIYEFIALIGIIISTMITVSKGVKSNPISPKTFSVAYWWGMNKAKTARAVAILLIIFACCRCSNEFFNIAVSFPFALALGAGADQLIEIWNTWKQKKIDSFKASIGIETITRPIENKPV